MGATSEYLVTPFILTCELKREFGIKSEVLTIYICKLDLQVGISNGLHHFIWEALENMGCRQRRPFPARSNLIIIFLLLNILYVPDFV